MSSPFTQNPFCNSTGMTLIEIMVVVALIGTMMALGSLAMFPGDDSKIREEASRLAGTIKYVYNEAAIKNQYYRIAFNLDTNQYQVESSTEPFYIQIETEKDKKPTQADKLTEAETETMPAAFVPEEENFKPVKLKSGIKIKDLLVLHSAEPREVGTEYAYFLPNGWVEPMVLNLCSEDEELCYSLEVNPLTGKVKIRGEYLELNPEALKQELE